MRQAGLLYYDNEERLEWEWQTIDGALTKAPFGGAGAVLVRLIVEKKVQKEVY